MLDIIADMHCHTIVSNHAFSTILENVTAAKEKGLKLIAITDHGPALDDAPHPYYFFNLNILPKNINGVNVLKGIEANIINYDGNIDIEQEFISNFEWIIASMHSPVLKPGSLDNHTKAWLNICKNPCIDVIGHSGTDIFKFNYDYIIKEFKANNKIVEINSASFKIREGAANNCRKIAILCKKYEVPIVVNSDCHFALNIGNVAEALKMLSEIEFPEKLIINTEYNKLKRMIKEIRGRNIESNFNEV